MRTHDDAPKLASELTRGPLLARNVGLNLVGWVLPALAAIIAVPILIRGLGDARFGLLALAWTTLGYFGLFDLGLGRAVTHAVGDRIGRQREDEIAGVIWTALAALVPLGLIGSAVLALGAPWLVRTVFTIPADLHRESISAFRLLAVAIPFVGAAAVLRGVLEAKQRFGLVNAVRVPYGVLLFLGPALALPFSRSVVPAIAILVVVRLALVAALFGACTRVVHRLWLGRSRVNVPALKALVSFGGWMTVSNVISPLMNTFDRYVIAAVLSVSVVTYYTSPSELVMKLWLFSVAINPVFFAALSTTGARDRDRSAELFDRLLRLTFAGLFLPALVLVVLAPEILGIWLGPSFTGDSALVLQVLAIAVFVNTLGQCGLTMIHALGRPDLTGKYHLAELPVYAAALWFLLARFGIVGVALAWAARAIVDAFLLLLTCPALLRETLPSVRRGIVWSLAAMLTLGIAMLLPSTPSRLAIALLALPVWAALAWRFILRPDERDFTVFWPSPRARQPLDSEAARPTASGPRQ